MKNSSVINNSSAYGGGIRCWSNANMMLENVLIANNTSSSQGGGMHLRSTASPTLINVTMTNNTADDYGGGFYIRDSANPIIINSVIWDNTPANIYIDANNSSNNITVSYTDLQGGQDSIGTNDHATVVWGDGNIDADPLFTDTANDDYSLTNDSRCIDAGHPDSTDADGTIADMGAYYYYQTGQPTRVVEFITTPDGNDIGLAWAANTDASSYNIYRSTAFDADFYSLTPSFTSPTNSYVDSSVSDASTYHYRIGAADADLDEGILAFAKHGRLGDDDTSIHLQDARLSHTTGSDLDNGTSFTMEAFVRFPGFPSAAVPFILIGDESISIGADGLIKMSVDGVEVDAYQVSDTSWHHVALTTDGSSSSFWVDGYSPATTTGTFNVNENQIHSLIVHPPHY